MSRNRHIANWDQNLKGLTDGQLLEQIRHAKSHEQSADVGMGRSPKGRRLWKKMRQAAEAELERRGTAEK